MWWSRLALPFVVFFDGLFEADVALRMEDHDAFRLHESGRRSRPAVLQILQFGFDGLGEERAAIKDRHHMATRWPWERAWEVFVPAGDIEQRESLLALGKPIAALDTRSPPFAVVAAGA